MIGKNSFASLFLMCSLTTSLNFAHAEDSVPDLSDNKNGIDGISPPQKITTPPAFYPTLSNRMGTGGTVTVSFIIRDDGTISNAVVAKSSGYADLDNGALAGVLEEFYRPASLNGHYMSVRWSETITYHLKD